MKKDTFILRSDWYESIKMLPQDQKGVLLDLFFLHHLSDEENNLTENLIENLKKPNGNLNNLLVIGFWNLIKPQLQAASDKYSKKLETSKQNGKLGGRPAKEKKPNQNLTENLKEPKKPYMNMSMGMNTDMSMKNDNVYENENGYADEKTEPVEQTSLSSIQKFEAMPPAYRAVSKWFERVAYPPDKKFLYSDIITDDDRLQWAEQWQDLEYHPALKPYIDEQRTRPFQVQDTDPFNPMQSFFKTLVEFAFVKQRDKWGEHLKDFNYLVHVHNGKPNIVHLATAYQRWLTAEEKRTRDMFPTLGN